MRKCIAIIFVWGLISTSSVLAQDAPLGLKWSSTVDSVRQTGIELKEAGSDAYGTGFSANKLSKALADQETTLLSFGYNDKLWRIVILSQNFANDPMGVVVRNRYQELLGILTDKYGKPVGHHRLGESIYSEPRFFLTGIQGGNSFWYSDFKASELDIQIGILATSGSDARWRIIYEYKPLKAIFEQSKKVREKGSL